MINVSIARRYARALIAVATEANRADEVLSELEALVKAIGESPDLRNVLESPGFSREQRQAFLTELASETSIEEPTVSFLRLLIDRGRTTHLEQITRLYRDLADEAAKRVRASVITPYPLDPGAAERLKSSLSTITGRSIELGREVDQTLIGGLVAKVGDHVFDGSIRTQLEKIRQSALS